jgi:hypothetical protein
MPMEYHHPLDPKCPAVVSFEDNVIFDDITEASGITEELRADFEHKHRIICERCQRYGAANIEIREVQ